jgi:hypothetical protein
MIREAKVALRAAINRCLRRRLGRGLGLCVGLVVIAAVAACGSSKSTATQGKKNKRGSIAVDTDRFPHGVHTGDKPEIRNWQGRGLACADCHDPKAVVEGKVSRPGTQQHSPCDDCHKAEFGKPPGKLCKVCHQEVNPFEKGKSPLQSYPERGTSQTLASTFSHKLHLDADKMDSAAGSHVACGDCHIRNDQTRDPELPGHAQCARCHEQVENVKNTLPMEKCDGCHPKTDVALTRGRQWIVGDLQFHHATHEKDLAGNSVKCETCHTTVKDSKNRKQMSIPAMERCAQCHEDSSRSPDRVRMANCGTCHSAIDAGTPPTDHLIMAGVGAAGGMQARPTDHTLHFRKHHSEQAAAKDAACRFCHTEVTGAKEDSCFQCHQLMRPQDHNLMFRDDHGRDAQTDADRCANCHAPEYCVGCHSIPPRSHTPLGEFRGGGHAELARFGLSSCLTCHTFEETCIKCHRGSR